MATPTLLSRVAWEDVNARVRREQRNREVYVPPISMYRWWARRPHALIGALIDAAAESRRTPVISDPFSGGGTVAMEAARRGLPFYAQDLHPWPVTGLATVLDGVDADRLDAACTALLARVDERCQDAYATRCPRHTGPSTLTHVFWARSKRCPGCRRATYLFPYPLLTLASRRAEEPSGYFGCPGCGAVNRRAISVKAARCSGCGRSLAGADTALLANRTVSCAHDECAATFPAFDGAPPAWSVVLVNRSCETNGGSVYHLDAPTTAEKRQPARQKAPAALSERIPEGEETSLLRRAGFNKWSDVFPTRQLSVMLETAHAIAELNTSETIRQRLRLALCGTAEMAGYLSRWDRYYPKAFEATANHRFPALGFSCETNLLAARGRGTLRRRLAHSVAAARWADTHLAVGGSVRTAVTTEKRRPLGAGALLARGSAERQLLPDQSVDLVLTDPPYFDDVQYAELASIFLAVARAFELVPAAVSLDLRSEAVANQHRGTGVEDYRTLLTKIFAEARRTLRPNGRIVLTFHNTDIRAWWALARALREAELRVCALAVAEAENATDHAKRGSNAFTSDLVIECRRTAKTSGEVDVVDCCDTAETRELLAAGQTLNEGGRDDLPTFTARYKRLCGTVDNPRIRLSRTESM